MKKFNLVLVTLVFGAMALTSCSSKEAKMDEAAMSPSSDGSAASQSASANLGGASSGQGR